MAEVYIGVGSNIGDRSFNIQKAARLLAGRYKLLRASTIYETEPEGYKSQPDFLNCVIQVQTGEKPHAMLSMLKGIEWELGRGKSFRSAPRIIDLDILFYNDQVIDSRELRVPHPLIAERRFVLVPMVEIAPDFMHPVLHKSMRQLLKECQPGSRVQKWGVFDFNKAGEHVHDIG